MMLVLTDVFGSSDGGDDGQHKSFGLVDISNDAGLFRKAENMLLNYAKMRPYIIFVWPPASQKYDAAL